HFGITHFPKLGENGYDLKRAGLIGSRSFTTREGDDLTIEAELSESAYSYLIAFQPDGKDELCDPDEDTPPERKIQPRYPPASQSSRRCRLAEGPGLHAFALVMSRAPLPPYGEWKRRHGPIPWAARQPCVPGVVWLDDNRGLHPLVAEGTAS